MHRFCVILPPQNRSNRADCSAWNRISAYGSDSEVVDDCPVVPWGRVPSYLTDVHLSPLIEGWFGPMRRCVCNVRSIHRLHNFFVCKSFQAKQSSTPIEPSTPDRSDMVQTPTTRSKPNRPLVSGLAATFSRFDVRSSRLLSLKSSLGSRL